MACLKALAAILACCLCPAASAQDRILIILADDLGVEQLGIYRPDATGLVRTPAIDEIAGHGLTFRNAWVNPLCSPTRATIQTGKYAFKTGIGNVIERFCPDYSLPFGEELPRLLAGHQTGAFGKWHLEDQINPDPLAPWSHGYGHFEGHIWSLPFQCGSASPLFCNPAQLHEGSNYFDWLETRIQSGQLTTAQITQYELSETVDSAIAWMAGVWPQSWLCYVAAQAPGELQHCPPPNLQSSVDCLGCSLDSRCPPGPFSNAQCFRGALGAFDTELGRLLRAIEMIDPQARPWWQTTTVFFLGDNGTGSSATGFWPAGQGKGSLFNGGIHVPFIVAGQGVPSVHHGQQTEAVANGVDVYATALALAGEGVAGRHRWREPCSPSSTTRASPCAASSTPSRSGGTAPARTAATSG